MVGTFFARKFLCEADLNVIEGLVAEKVDQGAFSRQAFDPVANALALAVLDDVREQRTAVRMRGLTGELESLHDFFDALERQSTFALDPEADMRRHGNLRQGLHRQLPRREGAEPIVLVS